jgi:hypothetical protein
VELLPCLYSRTIMHFFWDYFKALWQTSRSFSSLPQYLSCCRRRANFTAADMKEADFSGSTFNGAYLEKAVAYKANFTGNWNIVSLLQIVNLPPWCCHAYLCRLFLFGSLCMSGHLAHLSEWPQNERYLRSSYPLLYKPASSSQYKLRAGGLLLPTCCFHLFHFNLHGLDKYLLETWEVLLSHWVCHSVERGIVIGQHRWVSTSCSPIE